MMNATCASRSEAEVTSILEEFERSTGILNLTVEGISLWRLLRFEISLTMQKLGLPRPGIPAGEILSSMLGAIVNLRQRPAT